MWKCVLFSLSARIRICKMGKMGSVVWSHGLIENKKVNDGVNGLNGNYFMVANMNNGAMECTDDG
ncbi:hypothetical protein D8674_042111 [Pyrus ussuriensis x Pyrus communis]|uniref:Uncharacterized protein n=1 Tax=Pyrus ussuriensis x Pyrus communis TaxID=2448454 RepID=A0A5N5FN63_9ROSA|nr:hypothetical protein D8674_042111 [Pyrus ussuriensis x Pyrus communis]